MLLTALAAAAAMTSPSSAHVGDTVDVSASGLSKGRYALTLSMDDVAGRDVACVRRLATAPRAATRVSFTAKIPSRVQCWTNNFTQGAKIAVKPGRYHLIVAVPDGPSGFKGTFQRRALKVVR